MALLPKHAAPPAFAPIVEAYELTAVERTRLATDQRLQDYPHADYLSTKERDHLTFVAWRFARGDGQ
jgi:hypothetical protein